MCYDKFKDTLPPEAPFWVTRQEMWKSPRWIV